MKINFMNKKLYRLILLVVTCLGCSFALAEGDEANENLLRVHVFDVGAGNCVLLECPGRNSDGKRVNVLVDCGSNEANDNQLKVVHNIVELSRDRELNVVLSHPDQDHHNLFPLILTFPNIRYANGSPDAQSLIALKDVYVGGYFPQYARNGRAFPVDDEDRIYDDESTFDPTLLRYTRGQTKDAIDQYARGTVYRDIPSNPPVAPTQFTDREGVKRNRTTLRTATDQSLPIGQRIDVCRNSSVDVHILAGNSQLDKIKDNTFSNQQSIVLSVSYAGNTFIFPGDATNDPQDLALKKALDNFARIKGVSLNNDYDQEIAALKVEVMMAAHHGSDQKNSHWPGWARVTRPSVLIFSGNPQNPKKTLRHPKFAAFDDQSGEEPTYKAYLNQTDVYHVVSFGNVDAVKEKADNKFYTRQGKVLPFEFAKPIKRATDSAVFATHDVGYQLFEVAPTQAGAVKGDLSISCPLSREKWCNSPYLAHAHIHGRRLELEPPPPICGNAVKEENEECDNGSILNGYSTCGTSCSWQPCWTGSDGKRYCVY